MNTSKKNMISIKTANQLFQLGQYNEALRFYEKLQNQKPWTNGLLKTNIDLAKKHVSRSSLSTGSKNKNPDDTENWWSLNYRNIEKYIDTLNKENKIYEEKYEAIRQKTQKRNQRIMIGTLFSGENEFEQGMISIKKQSLPPDRVLVIKNKSNIEAHNELYDTFLKSDCDILIKLDADMVIIDHNFIKQINELTLWSSGKAIYQLGIIDHYTGKQIQGINIYTKKFKWDSNKTDPIFTDRSKLKFREKQVIWTRFSKSVIHSPNPSNFQAFHFGVHRAIKYREAQSKSNTNTAIEQLEYILNTYKHYQKRKTTALNLAALGGFMTLNGSFNKDHIDYTDNKLKEFYLNNIKGFDCKSKLENEVQKFYSNNPSIQKTNSFENPHWVKNACFIVPHLDVFGGILRFLEISRVFKRFGVNTIIATPHFKLNEAHNKNHQFLDLKIISLNEAMKQTWDVVMCGDFSSGLLLTLPFFKSKITATYLLNGWQHKYINSEQIKLINPDICIANSSYSAKHHPELAPITIPGGIDLQIFTPKNKSLLINKKNINILVPVGRNKPRKRFIDGYKACQKLSQKYNVTMHTFCQNDLNNLAIGNLKHIHHKSLNREEIAKLYSIIDIAIYPEEDAGWNNPAAEGMACGCPVICTEAGTTDFAINEDTALVVNRRDINGIVAAAELIIESDILRQKLVTNGLNIIKEYSWHIVGRRLLDIFEETHKAAQHREAISNIIQKDIMLKLAEHTDD